LTIRKSRYGLPASFDENSLPDSIMDQMRSEGTSWAYEIAESVAMHAKFLGLITFHISVHDILNWFEPILQWTDADVAAVRKWRETVPPIGTHVDTPAPVHALVDAYHAAIFVARSRQWRQ
jgi:hypothetical protein